MTSAARRFAVNVFGPLIELSHNYAGQPVVVALRCA
jgi:hypothetical protein